MILKDKNKIILTNCANFDIKDILECGQVFRYSKIPNGYKVYSDNQYAEILNYVDRVEIVSENVDYFYNYFDLDRDYNKICSQLSSTSEIMRQAVEYGKGIRILNQNLTEMIFSFIISANNNIKRIQSIIERICQSLGQKGANGYTFPTVEALATGTEELYLQLGCGYRSSYIKDTAQKIVEGYDIGRLIQMSTEEARKSLLTLKGVGPKVADCILLFGLKRQDVFPVDTWIEKVYHSYYESGLKQKDISRYFVETFGEYSGYAQQYLFYFQRQSIAKR